jgi:hypothetical protein
LTEAVNLPECLNQCFLGQVIRLSRVAGEELRNPQNGRPLWPHEAVEPLDCIVLFHSVPQAHVILVYIPKREILAERFNAMRNFRPAEKTWCD